MPPTNLPERAEPTGVAEPLLCPPLIFSRSDEPFEYGYRQLTNLGVCGWMGHAGVDHLELCLQRAGGEAVA